MEKGSNVERNSVFVKDAYDAGLSLRCTMFKGFPTETAEDLEKTAEFLSKHGHMLDRVQFNDFSLHEGTTAYNEIMGSPEKFSTIRLHGYDSANARALYRSSKGADKQYKKANNQIVAIVNAINAKPLRESAQFLDGVW
jgi:anaerobic magnesium-protoporphyrin IX monomethyl ester cyclase